MSLSGALSSAVSALNAQSTALAIVSDNIANASTTAYKTSSASFASMVTSSSASSYSSGSVSVEARANITQQGSLEDSSVSTNIAIQGSGFFVVADDSGELYYTRDGEFDLDNDGTLTNDGNALMGWPTDADGNVLSSTTKSTLEEVNVTEYNTYAAATTSVDLAANLPSNAAVGDTFASTMEVYDSLGTATTLDVTWAKTDANTWTATFSNPTSSSDGSVIAAVTSDPITVTFNSDGTLASTSDTTLAITGWTTGAADSAITLNFGTAGGTDGLVQYTDDSDTPSVTLKTSQDGIAYGTLSSISVDDGGTVTAAYSNGESRAIYKIAVATFTNANGLTAYSNGLYSSSLSSGTASLSLASSNGAGDIYGSKLEASTTDTNGEFSTMIAAQQAYSAAAQVMSTASDMYDTLMQGDPLMRKATPLKPVQDADADLLVQKIRLWRQVSQEFGDPTQLLERLDDDLSDERRQQLLSLLDDISALVARLEARKADVAGLLMAANRGAQATGAYARVAQVAKPRPIPIIPPRAKV